MCHYIELFHSKLIENVDCCRSYSKFNPNLTADDEDISTRRIVSLVKEIAFCVDDSLLKIKCKCICVEVTVLTR